MARSRTGASRDLPLLTEAERQQLLVEWNDTRDGVPAGRVHP